MTPRILVTALLVLALGAQASLAPRPPRDAAGARRPALRVLTYNIHHGEGLDGRIDLHRQAAVITSADADLVALQEVDQGTARAGRRDQLAELAALTGMHAAFGKAIDYQGGAYGVGVLSRAAPGRVKNRRLPGSPDREARTALTVEVVPGEGWPLVHFTTTHLDNGRDAMDKVAQASYLANSVSREAGQAGILAGDLNTRSDAPAMQILARRWTDTFADPPPLPDGRIRRRIDYVLVRPQASWRVVESRYVDAPLASDHQPVLVVLEWTTATR